MNTNQIQSGNGPDERPFGPKVLDHEKLEVYRLLLRFVEWVTPLIEEARTTAARFVEDLVGGIASFKESEVRPLSSSSACSSSTPEYQ